MNSQKENTTRYLTARRAEADRQYRVQAAEAERIRLFALANPTPPDLLAATAAAQARQDAAAAVGSCHPDYWPAQQAVYAAKMAESSWLARQPGWNEI